MTKTDSLQTENNSVNNPPAPVKPKAKVQAGFRIESNDYDDLVATFKAVNKRDHQNETELYLSALLYYRQHARIVNAVVTPENNDQPSRDELQSQLTDALTRLQTVNSDYEDLKTKLATHFQIEETPLTLAMVKTQQARAAKNMEGSKTLTDFVSMLYKAVREVVNKTELFQ